MNKKRNITTLLCDPCTQSNICIFHESLHCFLMYPLCVTESDMHDNMLLGSTVRMRCDVVVLCAEGEPRCPTKVHETNILEQPPKMDQNSCQRNEFIELSKVVVAGSI